jgi:CBS domain-containing protein
MDDIFVGRLMSTDVVTVTPDTDIEEAAEILLRKNIGSLVVVDEDNQPAGMLTSTDFVRIVEEGDPGDETTVGDHMSTGVVTVTAQDSIRDAADRIVTYDIHHVPVVDDTEGVIGMLSTTDLTAYLSDTTHVPQR